MKRILSVFIIVFALTALLACGEEAVPEPSSVSPLPAAEPFAEYEVVPATEATPGVDPVVVVPSPVPDEDPVIAAPPTEAPVSLPPLPTATPSPTPTPEPTPEPTPTPIPYDAEAEARMLKALNTDAETIRTVSTKGSQPSVLDSLGDDAKRVTPFAKLDGVWQHEWIVLDTVETDTRTYLHVRPIGGTGDGYIDARSVLETRLVAPESIYAVMVRPNGLVYSARSVASPVVAHVDYGVLRVIGVDSEKGFAAVVTGDGKTGYVEPDQIRYVGAEEFAAYLRQSMETPESVFSLETLVSDASDRIGEPHTDSAAFIYDLLRAEGLHFNEVYYRFYQKPLDDETLYPKHLYVTAGYNTLLFKLFNSAGNLVTCNGEETEWAYIGSYDEIEEGDILFFSDHSGKGNAVIPDVEVVIHGKYSGDVTNCGIYLGEGRMLTVRNGRVADVEIDQITQSTFDCARRISSSVTDERAHFIECMISAIYDRLGTPYHSIKRTGDAAYDCSGLICWFFRGYDYYRAVPKEPTLDLTAQAWSQVNELLNGTSRMTFVDTGIPKGDREALKNLQRGDLVLLLNEKRNRVGHVMVYLGDNTVIHSTTIDSRYRGTLVARFRSHLQRLYYCSRRIEDIRPLN